MGMRAELIKNGAPIKSGGVSSHALVSAGPSLVPVCSLRVGDLVQTRDSGLQPIQSVNFCDQSSYCKDAVEIAEGILGVSSPLQVCGNQHVLLSGWLISALFSQTEVLVEVGLLHNAEHIRIVSPQSGRFCMIGFAEQQLINCNGAWVASHIEEGTTPYKYVRPLLNAYAHEVVAESRIFTKRAGGSPAHNISAHKQVSHG